MQKMIPLFFILVAMLFNAACSDDDETTKSIEGKWVRTHSVTNIPISITFFEDGTFIWEPVVQTDLHTASSGSYTFSNSELVVFDHADCPGMEGKFSVIVKCDTIEIDIKDDECTPRGLAMEGRWMRE